MQIDLVNQDYARRLEARAVIELRVELRTTHRDVGGCGGHVALAVAQGAERKPVGLELDDDIVLLEIEIGGDSVFDAIGNSTEDGVEG